MFQLGEKNKEKNRFAFLRTREFIVAVIVIVIIIFIIIVVDIVIIIVIVFLSSISNISTIIVSRLKNTYLHSFQGDNLFLELTKVSESSSIRLAHLLSIGRTTCFTDAIASLWRIGQGYAVMQTAHVVAWMGLFNGDHNIYNNNNRAFEDNWSRCCFFRNYIRFV